MDEELILKKLEKLSKLRRLIKEKKIRRLKDKQLKFGFLSFEDDDDEYDDGILSHAELIEEALKEYMYQFGLSIYQNKQGEYYFKHFENDIDTRDFEELDMMHFSLNEKEPSFLEKILEVVPENRIHLTDNMETTVLDFYSKDEAMAEILDYMVNNQIEKCSELLNDKSYLVQNENSNLQEQQNIMQNFEEKPLDNENSTVYNSEQLNTYQCGESRDEKINLSKPLKVRRIKKEPASAIISAVKDNSNTR